MDALVKLALVALTFVMLSDFRFLKTSADIDTNFRFKRHTPFLPGDYWKGRRPDFGETDLSPEVMVNGTAKLKCPITHVADSSVSKQKPISYSSENWRAKCQNSIWNSNADHSVRVTQFHHVLFSEDEIVFLQETLNWIFAKVSKDPSEKFLAPKISSSFQTKDDYNVMQFIKRKAQNVLG